MHLNYNVIVMYYLRDICVVFLSLHLDLLSNLHMWKNVNYYDCKQHSIMNNYYIESHPSFVCIIL